MPEVAELFLPPFEEADDDGGVADYPETLEDSSPFWRSASPGPAVNLGDFFVPVFSPGRPSDGDSDSDSDYLHDPVSLALDLFERLSPPPPRESPNPFPETLDSYGFGVLDGVDDMGSDYLSLGLGLGPGFETHEDGGSGGSANGKGLRIVGFESDSDSDDGRIAAVGDGFDGGRAPDLCWDCVGIEEDRRGPDEDFEWEEVDGRLGDLEVLSMMVGMEDDVRGELDNDDPDLDEEREVGGNVEWEVLLAGNNLAANPFLEPEDAESYIGDDHEDFFNTLEYHEEFINTLEYEVLFGQFADQESSLRGSPPAAKSVVENLPSIVLTEEDVAKNNTLCAVCKDEISLEDRAKQLPCLHRYHGGCILPWLGIRNTCPVCRYELPTDDPEYESWKARRAASAGHTEESLLRYDVENLR